MFTHNAPQGKEKAKQKIFRISPKASLLKRDTRNLKRFGIFLVGLNNLLNSCMQRKHHFVEAKAYWSLKFLQHRGKHGAKC
jgi:hypothetical protein